MDANTTQIKKESPTLGGNIQGVRKNNLLNKKHLFGTKYADGDRLCAVPP